MSHFDHLRRCIAGKDGYSTAAQKKGILAGSTIQFEDLVPVVKNSFQKTPDDSPLGAADGRSREQLVVGFRDTVESYRSSADGETLRVSHASTSAAVE
jgi:hypothetical protein